MWIIKGSDAADAQWFDLQYQTVKQGVERERGGYTMKEEIEIALMHGSVVLEAMVEVIKRAMGKRVEVERKLISSHCLGFDHGLKLQMGVDR